MSKFLTVKQLDNLLKIQMQKQLNISFSGKGVVSVDEMKEAMLEVMGEELVDEMLNDADVNKNGLIDYDEFIKRVMSGI